MKRYSLIPVSIEFNSETQMYDCYRIATSYCPCCHSFLGEEKIYLKSISIEEYNRKAAEEQSLFTF